MNSIVKRKALVRVPLIYHTRKGGHWNRDWKPAKLPTTSAEHEAAAKKYNLLPEEYTPLKSKVGSYAGDYPSLPDISVENKDIFYPWDLPDERRNFGEPLHENAAWYGEQRVDTHARQKFKYSPLQMFLGLLTALLILYSPSFTPFIFFPPVAARQYPKQGIRNYSYELKQ